MSAKARIALISAVMTVTIALDQITKVLAAEHLRGGPTHAWLGGLARLTYAENRGAMLSLGDALSEGVRFWIFQVGVTAVLLGMLFFAVTRRELTRLQVVALSLLIGGGLGNVIDRALYDGAVIDFMILGKDWWKTGVFNVADVAIMAGCGILLLSTARAEPAPDPAPAAKEEP
jgi:signal peptidase II